MSNLFSRHLYAISPIFRIRQIFRNEKNRRLWNPWLVGSLDKQFFSISSPIKWPSIQCYIYSPLQPLRETLSKLKVCPTFSFCSYSRFEFSLRLKASNDTHNLYSHGRNREVEQDYIFIIVIARCNVATDPVISLRTYNISMLYSVCAAVYTFRFILEHLRQIDSRHSKIKTITKCSVSPQHNGISFHPRNNENMRRQINKFRVKT